MVGFVSNDDVIDAGIVDEDRVQMMVKLAAVVAPLFQTFDPSSDPASVLGLVNHPSHCRQLMYPQTMTYCGRIDPKMALVAIQIDDYYVEVHLALDHNSFDRKHATTKYSRHRDFFVAAGLRKMSARNLDPLN